MLAIRPFSVRAAFEIHGDGLICLQRGEFRNGGVVRYEVTIDHSKEIPDLVYAIVFRGSIEENTRNHGYTLADRSWIYNSND